MTNLGEKLSPEIVELVRNLMHPVPEMRPSASQLLQVRKEFHGLDIAHTVQSSSTLYNSCCHIQGINYKIIGTCWLFDYTAF